MRFGGQRVSEAFRHRLRLLRLPRVGSDRMFERKASNRADQLLIRIKLFRPK